MGSPFRCPLSCPLFPYMEVVGSLLSCPLSCPLFPYMEVVGSLICMAKFPWAAHGQPTPLPTCSPRAAKWAAPLFFSLLVVTFEIDISFKVTDRKLPCYVLTVGFSCHIDWERKKMNKFQQKSFWHDQTCWPIKISVLRMHVILIMFLSDEFTKMLLIK